VQQIGGRFAKAFASLCLPTQLLVSSAKLAKLVAVRSGDGLQRLASGEAAPEVKELPALDRGPKGVVKTLGHFLDVARAAAGSPGTAGRGSRLAELRC
jgi:hypothetical protein